MTTREIAQQEGLDVRRVRNLMSQVIKHYSATDALHAYAIAVAHGHLSPRSVTWSQQWEEHSRRRQSHLES